MEIKFFSGLKFLSDTRHFWIAEENGEKIRIQPFIIVMQQLFSPVMDQLQLSGHIRSTMLSKYAYAYCLMQWK